MLILKGLALGLLLWVFENALAQIVLQYQLYGGKL